MARVTLGDLARRFAEFPVKFEACVGIELKRVGMKVRDTAVRKFGTYQPAIGEWPAWAKLADATIAAKARAGGGEDPLIGHYPSSHHRVWPTTLRQSIEMDVEGLVVHVGSANPLAEYHEFGTGGSNAYTDKLTGSKSEATNAIPPRPFLRPAGFENEEYFQERMGEAAAAAIKLF